MKYLALNYGRPSMIETHSGFLPLSLLNKSFFFLFEMLPVDRDRRQLITFERSVEQGGWAAQGGRVKKWPPLSFFLWLTVSVAQLCGREHQRPLSQRGGMTQCGRTDSTFDSFFLICATLNRFLPMWLRSGCLWLKHQSCFHTSLDVTSKKNNKQKNTQNKQLYCSVFYHAIPPTFSC